MTNIVDAIKLLKAWRRLSKVGFRFLDWELDPKTIADGKIWFDLGINVCRSCDECLKDKKIRDAMELIFGEEYVPEK